MRDIRKLRISTVFILGVLVVTLGGTSLVIAKNALAGEIAISEPKDIEKTWKSYFVKNSVWSHLDSIVSYYATGQLCSEQVIMGNNGWLFFKAKTDSDPIADFEGTNSFSEDEIANCVDGMKKIEAYCDTNNIDYSVLLVPNKENVYFENMPDSYVHAEESRTDKLASKLIEEGINVVNCKDALIKAKETNQIYYAYDTHWNRIGSNTGLKLSLESMGVPVKSAEELTITSSKLKDAGYHYCGKDDLAEMVGMRGIKFNDDIEYEFDEYPTIDWDEFEKEQEAGAVSYFHNPDAENKAKLLLIGDSFRTALVPGLSYYFSDVYIVHVNNSNKKVIEEVKPDYLLLQYVERYSYRLLDIDKLVK